MLSIIITVYTDFGDYATPLIESIREHEPDVEIIAVDNASTVPFPEGDYTLIRLDKKHTWSHMLNVGARAAANDWLMMLNDDVMCDGKFLDIVDGFDKNALYGNVIHKKPPEWVGKEITYLYAWLLLMQKDIYNEVGGFDEGYIASGVDDIDFCWTAQQFGHPLKLAGLPFRHVTDEPGFVRRRKKWDANYKANMEHNRLRFEKKVKQWSTA